MPPLHCPRGESLNAIEGVQAVADLEGKCARVTLSADVSNETLAAAVTEEATK